MTAFTDPAAVNLAGSCVGGPEVANDNDDGVPEGADSDGRRLGSSYLA